MNLYNNNKKNIAAMRPFIRREAGKKKPIKYSEDDGSKNEFFFFTFFSSYLFCSINKNKIQFKLFNYFILFYSFSLNQKPNFKKLHVVIPLFFVCRMDFK